MDKILFIGEKFVWVIVVTYAISRLNMAIFHPRIVVKYTFYRLVRIHKKYITRLNLGKKNQLKSLRKINSKR